MATLGEKSKSDESVNSPKERTRKGRGSFKSPIPTTVILKMAKSKESLDDRNKDIIETQNNNEDILPEINDLAVDSDQKSTRSNSVHSIEEWERLELEDQEEKSPQVDFESTTGLDVSGFPPHFKTHDVIAIFKSVDTSGLKLKWINDTSAIAIFPNQELAKRAYIATCQYPLANIKPCQTPVQTSNSHNANSIRPTTTDMVARRLIAGALGMRPPKKSQEEKQSDELKLYNARERKERVKRDKEKREKELDDTWNS
ncbi:Coiled-coil domain-containing protein r3hcc1l [Terramyces sp. JEL0728]|nr:Coiled-coil domain-containing protein r3hcc1l [Terramyces sp. JEL0728]